MVNCIDTYTFFGQLLYVLLNFNWFVGRKPLKIHCQAEAVRSLFTMGSCPAGFLKPQHDQEGSIKIAKMPNLMVTYGYLMLHLLLMLFVVDD